MAPQVIDQKLESLRRCLVRIESKQPFDAAQLADDFDLQDIVTLNLTRAVQMAVDIGAHIAASQNQPGPATMAGTFEQLYRMGVITMPIWRFNSKSLSVFATLQFITTAPSIGKWSTPSLRAIWTTSRTLRVH